MLPDYEQRNCPNCEHYLIAGLNYCPQCGQKVLTHTDHSFRHLVVDSIGDYFHVDGKFLHSLLPLMISPGKMTSEYLSGRRARFIQPFKLVLIISVIYFLMVALSLKNVRTAQPAGNKRSQQTEAAESHNQLNFSVTFYDRVMPVDSVRKLVSEKGKDAFLDELDPDASWFERFIGGQIINFALLGPEEFLKKMVHHASKIVFLLIPFVALLFKLLYLRKRRLYYNHLIFSIHFHAFFFLLLLFYQVISMFLFSIPLWIILLILLAYLLISMKNVYQQKWFITSIKMITMVFLYLLIALPLFALLLIAVSVLL
ncbi:MAG: DUF3667 domain-containing protein [Bacteroidales bacterium]